MMVDHKNKVESWYQGGKSETSAETGEVTTLTLKLYGRRYKTSQAKKVSVPPMCELRLQDKLNTFCAQTLLLLYCCKLYSSSQLLQRSNRKHPDWKHHKLAWFMHGLGQEGSTSGD